MTTISPDMTTALPYTMTTTSDTMTTTSPDIMITSTAAPSSDKCKKDKGTAYSFLIPFFIICAVCAYAAAASEAIEFCFLFGFLALGFLIGIIVVATKKC